jgi:CRISPR-associated protein Cst1
VGSFFDNFSHPKLIGILAKATTKEKDTYPFINTTMVLLPTKWTPEKKREYARERYKRIKAQKSQSRKERHPKTKSTDSGSQTTPSVSVPPPQQPNFRISTRDWLTNSAMMGYIRIQERRGRNVNVAGNYLEILPEDLDGFGDAYFSYVLEQYEFLPFLFKEVRTKLQKIIQKDSLNSFVRRFFDLRQEMIMKTKLNFANFDANLSLVRDKGAAFTQQVLTAIKQLGIDQSKLTDIAEIFESRNIEFAKQFEAKADFIVTLLKRFYFNKAIVGNYSISSNFRKKEFELRYVKKAKSSLASIQGDGLTCRICQTLKIPFSSFEEDEESVTFGEGNFSPIAVSLSKFPNFFYNFTSNLILCPMCELLLLCAWAGFTKVPSQLKSDEAWKLKSDDYIFVNMPSLAEIKDQNEFVSKFYEYGKIRSDETIYEEVIKNLFLKEREKKALWTIEHVFFVEITPSSRKDRNRPSFHYFSVGKDVAKLFQDKYAIGAFRNIRGVIELVSGMRVNLKRYVLRKILERKSLDADCFKLLLESADRQTTGTLSSVFSIVLLQTLLSTFQMAWSDVQTLNSKQIYGIMRHWEGYGSNFSMLDLKKRQRISYKLLSAIRSGRKEDFLDYIIKLYVGQGLAVPSDLHFVADDEENFTFERKAYAFIVGFLSESPAQSSNTQSEAPQVILEK